MSISSRNFDNEFQFTFITSVCMNNPVYVFMQLVILFTIIALCNDTQYIVICSSTKHLETTYVLIIILSKTVVVQSIINCTGKICPFTVTVLFVVKFTFEYIKKDTPKFVKLAALIRSIIYMSSYKLNEVGMNDI